MTLTLDRLSKTFPGGVRAVDDLSLEVAAGEVLVLVGPSGSGKTTVLRMIAGLEMPSHGSIVLGGRVLDGLPPRDRGIAMVFQHGALYPHLSVYGNMAFGLTLRRTAKAEIERRVARGRRDAGDRRPPGPPPRPTLRRPAATRRPGPGDGPAAGTVPLR